MIGAVSENEVEAAAEALASRYAGWTWSQERWRTIARVVLEAAADPVLVLAGMNARRKAFEEAHPYLTCPACRKRVSARYDTIDAEGTGPKVRCQCHRCNHKFEVDRA